MCAKPDKVAFWCTCIWEFGSLLHSFLTLALPCPLTSSPSSRRTASCTRKRITQGELTWTKLAKLACLASQTYFCKNRKGLVTCIYEPCPTGMQLANQIFKYSTLEIPVSKWAGSPRSVVKYFYSFYSSRKRSPGLLLPFSRLLLLLKQWCNVSCVDRIGTVGWPVYTIR